MSFLCLKKRMLTSLGMLRLLKKWRIIAEKEANKRTPYNDVNLDEIYQAMKALPEEERNWLKGKMETRDSLKNVLDLLDKNQLRQMGYKAEKLFSNNFQAEKCSPEL